MVVEFTLRASADAEIEEMTAPMVDWYRFHASLDLDRSPTGKKTDTLRDVDVVMR
jgi:hypothetical protein